MRQYRLFILQQLVVPESQHAKTSRIQERRPLRVVLGLLRMLSAIKLDHDAVRRAGEIDDIAADAMLPTEFRTDLLIAQAMPEPRFRIGLFSP